MIVTLIGLSISFFAYFIAFPHAHQRRFDIYLLILAMHLTAAIAYWLYSFESGMDAFIYYRDPYGYARGSPFNSGTYFIVHLDQFIRRTLGGSFLDHFLFFQCFGMLGMALLARCLNEVAESLQLQIPLVAYVILLFPGIHFWSVAIGKDAPMIMATSLALWASMKIERRLVWMGIALLIMVPIRPHVAAISVFAMGGTIFLSRSVSTTVKLVLGLPAAAAVIWFANVAIQQLGVGGADLGSISEFVENQQNLGEDFGSGANIQALPYPLKVLTLLFRPLWLDASGMLGLVASAENTLLLGIFGYMILKWRILLQLFRNVPFVTYGVIFSGLLILLLSLVSYNIGLGQRQKMMAVVPVLLIVATIYMYQRFLAALSHAAGEAPHEPEPSQPSTAAA